MAFTYKFGFAAAFLTIAIAGCGGGDAKNGGAQGSGSGGAADGEEFPTFKLAWSEYPSWSAFDVAQRHKLINGKAGEYGPIEEKWKVDIELVYKDYDPCITAYASSQVDAVCITNIDVIAQSLSRPSVAILPTSTSNGADACIVVGIDDAKQLREHKVFGLEKSVSQYAFVRGLETLGEKEADHQFTNKDPAAAALAVQQKDDATKAIMVWNPYVLDTLRKSPDAKVLFDSSSIPGEIIDMVVMGEDSLKKPGGDAFACAVIDAYYQINQVIEDPSTRDTALVQIGEKFSSLGLEDMKVVVEQTKFYKNAEEGLAVFEGPELPKTMETVAAFCKAHEMPQEGAPTIGYGPEASGNKFDLRFDPSFMAKVRDAEGTAK